MGVHRTSVQVQSIWVVSPSTDYNYDPAFSRFRCFRKSRFSKLSRGLFHVISLPFARLINNGLICSFHCSLYRFNHFTGPPPPCAFKCQSGSSALGKKKLYPKPKNDALANSQNLNNDVQPFTNAEYHHDSLQSLLVGAWSNFKAARVYHLETVPRQKLSLQPSRSVSLMKFPAARISCLHCGFRPCSRVLPRESLQGRRLRLPLVKSKD